MKEEVVLPIYEKSASKGSDQAGWLGLQCLQSATKRFPQGHSPDVPPTFLWGLSGHIFSLVQTISESTWHIDPVCVPLCRRSWSHLQAGRTRTRGLCRLMPQGSFASGHTGLHVWSWHVREPLSVPAAGHLAHCLLAGASLPCLWCTLTERCSTSRTSSSLHLPHLLDLVHCLLWALPYSLICRRNCTWQAKKENSIALPVSIYTVLQNTY